MPDLSSKTIIITGASRGIGREIALRCAADGANIVIAAKTTEPHPKLPGTIYSVADEVISAGGQALPIQVDVRDEHSIAQMIEQTTAHFGGIDMLINNAGAIRLTPAEKTPISRFDLMHQINTRAVLLCSQLALPWLKKSDCAHILNLSPPINLNKKWFKDYTPYTITKYAMSMLTLGLAEEFRSDNIAVNSLWPKTTIATAAVEFEAGGKDLFNISRTPAIMADAAYAILTSGTEFTGNHCIDENLLRERGVTEFDHYAVVPGTKAFFTDLYID
ncbi:SDR family oxidoreductase [Endozoicomonas sp.]|uniref:SDR family oxidoreductase n=1 Tax=Endozoicomonas sp. TaxID=1892382 RepID=UPI002883CBFD|nr:NAD(P)-dependent oxidoreductase [Endozoicomonas sp.]